MKKILLKGITLNLLMITGILGLTLTSISLAQSFAFREQIKTFKPFQLNSKMEANTQVLQTQIESLKSLLHTKDGLYVKALNNKMLYLGVSCFLFHVIFLALLYRLYFNKSRI